MEKKRWAQIIDALAELFDTLKTPNPAYDIVVKTIQKQYVHWTTLDQQNAIPAILLQFGETIVPSDDPTRLGFTLERLPVLVSIVLKHDATMPKPLTDQASDTNYAISKLINGSRDLGVDGVVDVAIEQKNTSAAVISILDGTPFEVLQYRVVVSHTYRKYTAV